MSAVEAERSMSTPPASEAVSLATVAWLAAVPVLVAGVAIGALVGRPLGRFLFPPDPRAYTFLPNLGGVVSPQPTQHARYLIALLVPAAFALALLRSADLGRRAPSRLVTAMVVSVQLIAVALAAWFFHAQHHVWIENHLAMREYFPSWGLVAAVPLAAGGVWLVTRGWRPRWVQRTVGRRWELGLGLAVVALTALWLLPDIYRDQNFARAPFDIRYNTMFSADDILSVANGRSPLVDYVAQYSSLWPYVLSPVLGVFHYTVGAFTGAMTLLTLAAFLCVFRVLRRATGDLRIACALYVPVLAVSLYPLAVFGDQRVSWAVDYAVYPLRYVGPYVVALLCARHLDGDLPRRRFALFAAAGLVALNNAEFGIPAFGAAIVALFLAGEPDRLVSRATVLVRDAALGLLIAVALVSMLTLLRTGALPHFSYVTYFAGLFAIGGMNQLPMPALGLHLILYMTFVAALLVAALRARRSARRTTLTGMLGFSAIFGLGASSYYVGRSHPDVLGVMFSAWAISVALLAWVAVGALRRSVKGGGGHQWLRSAVPAAAVFACLGLMATDIVHFPTPLAQLSRIAATGAGGGIGRPGAIQFVASNAHRREPVLLLIGLGHDVARRAGVVNVSPFNHPESIFTVQQLQFTVARLRAKHGTRIFAVTENAWPNPARTVQGFDALSPQHAALLRADGYVPILTDPASGITEWLPLVRR